MAVNQSGKSSVGQGRVPFGTTSDQPLHNCEVLLVPWPSFHSFIHPSIPPSSRARGRVYMFVWAGGSKVMATEKCSEPPHSASTLSKDLAKSFRVFERNRKMLQTNVKETVAYFAELQHCDQHEAAQSSLATFPQHELEYLNAVATHSPCLVLASSLLHVQLCLLEAVLGENPLSWDGVDDHERKCPVHWRSCKLRHAVSRRSSLVLPGQYELVQAAQISPCQGQGASIAALRLPDTNTDAALQQAELELALPHPLLKEVSVLLAPSFSVQSLGSLLEDCRRSHIPLLVYAIDGAVLSENDIRILQELGSKTSDPVFFLCLDGNSTTPCADQLEMNRIDTKDQIMNRLHSQLIDLGFIEENERSSTGPGMKPQASVTWQASQLALFVRQFLQAHLVEATGVVSGVHARGLDLFISHAFDMARDLQITPRRLEYAQAKEAELYQSLLEIASQKQEEIRDMIVLTMERMRSEMLQAAAEMELTDIAAMNGDCLRARDVQSYSRKIQDMVLARLKQAVAKQLISSVDYLRESFVGTLARCLESLERSGGEPAVEHPASAHLRQILNAAYHVEVTFHSGSSAAFLLWEQIKKLWQSLTWNAPPALTPEWKRKVAQDTIESLNASKLARNICSQFQTRVNYAHEAFATSLHQLEMKHSGRLERTEGMWMKVRKDHAPRLACLSLESRSLRDLLLHGMPRLGHELGRGQYGVVYACDSWAGHATCALKSVIPPDEKHWNDLALEFHYTRSLPRHDRLVALHGSVIDHTYGGGTNIAVLLIMERLHRDLYTAIKTGMLLSARLQVALDVVEGLRFLHGQGLVHRDIKLKNVLLDKTNRAKITDLGFCKPEAMMSGSIVGTPIHMAPELFTGKYDNSVDVYAFGILFWYICAGSVRLPEAFEKCGTKDQLWNNVRKGTRPERLASFDDECWRLMEVCWNGEPSLRPLLGIVEPQLLSIAERLCSIT
uniref:Dual serine/threonine and tyrosine protein kinase n=1 Tax=Eptatretus burgeri TaxID=7764 RepID=A0A8C4R7A6_EPTBU